MPTRGEIRQDGKVFIALNSQCENGEWWGSQEQLNAVRLRDKLRHSNGRKVNAAHISELRRTKYKENRDAIIAGQKLFYSKNRDAILEKSRLRRLKNRGMPENRNSRRLKQARFLSADPINRVILNSRGRIGSFMKLKGMLKSSKTLDMIGCNKTEFRNWLTSKFQIGMAWNNYGKWHIDHIIPLSWAENPDEVYELCHYTNLQPLWAKDNSSKHDNSPYSNKADALKALRDARAALQKEALEV